MLSGIARATYPRNILPLETDGAGRYKAAGNLTFRRLLCGEDKRLRENKKCAGDSWVTPVLLVHLRMHTHQYAAVAQW